MKTATIAAELIATRAARDRLDRNAALCRRAARITLRKFPARPAGHGFRNPVEFVVACQERAARERFYRETVHRLVAKHEARQA